MTLLHPDRGGSEDAASEVNHAYSVLSDPRQRSAYNESLTVLRRKCQFCGELVSSLDVLDVHIAQHRADVEAASGAKSTIGGQSESSDRQASGSPSPADVFVAQGARASGTRSEGGPSTAVGSGRALTEHTAILVGAAAALGLLIVLVIYVAPWYDSSTRTTTKAEPTVGGTAISELRTSTSSPRVDLVTTSVGPQPPAADLSRSSQGWNLDLYAGTATIAGTVEDPWSQQSEQWTDFWDDSFPLTVDGVPGFEERFHQCLEELCDYRLLGIQAGDTYLWQTMGFLWSSDVLRFTAPPGASVAVCWSAERNAPVVMTGWFNNEGRIQSAGSAWMIPSWHTDGEWRGVDLGSFAVSSVRSVSAAFDLADVDC